VTTPNVLPFSFGYSNHFKVPKSNIGRSFVVGGAGLSITRYGFLRRLLPNMGGFKFNILK